MENQTKYLIEVGFGRISRIASTKEQMEQNVEAYKKMGYSPVHVTELKQNSVPETHKKYMITFLRQLWCGIATQHKFGPIDPSTDLANCKYCNKTFRYLR